MAMLWMREAQGEVEPFQPHREQAHAQQMKRQGDDDAIASAPCAGDETEAEVGWGEQISPLPAASAG